MSEQLSELKIFLGDGESPELTALARRKEEEGFMVARDSGDPRIQQALSLSAGKKVVVEGAKLPYCVKSATEAALDNGAAEVVIDLRKTFTDEDDVIEHEHVLQERAHSFSIFAIGKRHNRDKSKVKVIPEDIWKKELGRL